MVAEASTGPAPTNHSSATERNPMPTSEPINQNLDAIITKAIETKIEASVLAALSGDETIGRMVTAALQQKVEINRRDGGYGKETVPFLSHVVHETIRAAAHKAVRAHLETMTEQLAAEVAKQLRKSSAGVAKQMVDQLAERASSAYGIKVEIQYPGSGD